LLGETSTVAAGSGDACAFGPSSFMIPRRSMPPRFKHEVENLERELIRRGLEEARGNQAEAARRLGLTYHQFRYYHAKHFS
jgi:transcriptional regulator with GAF, ATPase, and Fis domain